MPKELLVIDRYWENHPWYADHIIWKTTSPRVYVWYKVGLMDLMKWRTDAKLGDIGKIGWHLKMLKESDEDVERFYNLQNVDLIIWP